MPSADELVLDDGAIVRGEIDYKGEPENFQARILWFTMAFTFGACFGSLLLFLLAG